MKIVMTFAMVLATSALFAQQNVNTKLRSQVTQRSVSAVAKAPNKELRPVTGVVRVGKGQRTVHIEVRQENGLVNFVPVNLPEDMKKEGEIIKFQYAKLGDGKISLRNVSVK